MLRSGVEIRPATVADALALAPRLRRADRREIEAAGGGDIAARLVSAVETSFDAQAVMKAGALVLLFGFAAPDLFGNTAIPWALGTADAGRVLGTHARFVSAYLARVRQTYPHLVNLVDARNAVAIRWLSAIGFTVHPAAPLGADGAPFRRFEMGGSTGDV